MLSSTRVPQTPQRTEDLGEPLLGRPEVEEEEPSKVFCAELSPRTLLCLPTRLLPSGVVGLPRGIGRKYAKAAISVELNRTDRQNSNKGREAHSIYPQSWNEMRLVITRSITINIRSVVEFAMPKRARASSGAKTAS